MAMDFGLRNACQSASQQFQGLLKKEQTRTVKAEVIVGLAVAALGLILAVTTVPMLGGIFVITGALIAFTGPNLKEAARNISNYFKNRG